MNDLPLRARAGSALSVSFALILTLGSASSSAAPAQTASAPIPNFAPDDHTSWYPDRRDGDNFLSPESGPGPIVSRKDYPYVPNGAEDFAATHPTYRVADLSNPILQPWVIAQMTRDNDEVIAGKIPFMARERCYPGGVPEWEIFRRVAPPMIFFVQTPKLVLMIWRGDNQVRHIYMNVPHSARPKPSWFGESIGHYEGDTLVVDTIGQNTKTFVDNYRTPHTDQLHVVERFRMTNGGKAMEVLIHVEDPGAFTTPWNAVQRYARFEGEPGNDGKLVESACAESAAYGHFDFGNYGASHSAELAPVPQSDRPDF
ncbi:MAG TPA: hypothetical protein VK479_10590 [Micropepsaceae bacterium]|nr:hypothetical protein [Micropepsaceae bacterium]